MKSYPYNLCVALIVAMALSTCTQQTEPVAFEEGSILAGQVSSLTGEPLAGIPVRARRDGSTFAVVVYTDQSGKYSFPQWSDLTPGAHTVSITLPDFEHATQQGAALMEGQAALVDFTLAPRQPTFMDATTAEIVTALPGTDEQKVLVSQCGTCHSLQTALQTPSNKEGWMAVVRTMMGERFANMNSPNSMTFNQGRFIEPLGEYLASIRGPGSSDELPFRLRPRPTDPASTNLVFTEYEIPRGGHFEPHIFRGDPRFVWPHDVIVDDNYAWYTDHFSYVLGRVDKRTGEAVELPYPLPPGGGRDLTIAAGQDRAGTPGGGSHDMVFDSQGNVVIGMGDATVRYNPRTDEFVHWTTGDNMFGLDLNDHVWAVDCGGTMFELDTNSGDIVEHAIPNCEGVYGMDTDSEGRSLLNAFRGGSIDVFDPRTGSYTKYPVPTPGAGPRRGEIDAEGRLWVGLYYAGRVARFDPDTGEIVEFPLIPRHGGLHGALWRALLDLRRQ